VKNIILLLLLFVFIFVSCKKTKHESKYETLNDSSLTSKNIYSATSSKEDTNRLNNKINIDINQLLGIWYYPEDINATFKIVKDSMFYVDANEWYREGGGNPLFVNAAKIDLSPVKKSDFSKVGDSFYKNFAFTTNTETGLVYGNIKLTLMNDKGVIKLGGTGGLLDKYDFDYKSGVKNIPRNIDTWIGKQRAGKGTGYDIFNYGTGTVK